MDDTVGDLAFDASTTETRRSQFVGATLSLLETLVPADISMDDIAHEAGVSRPLLYTYFADRDALLIAAYDEFFASLQTDVDAIVAGDDPDDKMMRDVIRTYLVFAKSHESQYRHLLDGGLVLHPQIRAQRKERFQRLASVFGEGADTVLVATVVVGILETAALAWLDHGAEDVDATTELLFNLTWRGVQSVMPR